MNAPAGAVFLGPYAHLWATVLATARSFVKRTNAYLIDVIRWPLGTLIYFATMLVTYSASGREEVEGTGVSSYLLVGMFGLIMWTSTIWASGYAIEYERYEGTIGALFLSPASRVAVVAGYGLGSLLWLLPSFVLVTILGVATGARLNVADPLGLLAAGLAVLAGSLATGFAFAGLFVLSRRANLVANFLQLPVQLLAGFLVPRGSLPGWLRPLSELVPASHAVDALRAGALGGATLRDGVMLKPLLLALGVSALYAAVGFVSLRKVEDAAKRSGQLDLY